MAHLHEMRDSDTHFVIDPITMEIINNSAKHTLQQGDHNSEIYSFELPKVIEGHDMTLCNLVQIHYINIKGDKTEQSKDIHKVTDIAVSDTEADTLVFTWTVHGNATKYAGSLNFRIHFYCIDDAGNYTYKKHTEIFKGITISDGFNNAETVEEDNSDILAQWEARLDALENSDVVKTVNGIPPDENGNVEIEAGGSADKETLDKIITSESVVVYSRNRFDKASAESGAVLITSTGATTANSGRATSNFIEFENGQAYLISRWYASQNRVEEIPIYAICYYDTNKNYLGYGEAISSGTLYYEGAKYFRTSIVLNRLDTAMIFVGDIDVSDVTGYIEFSEPSIVKKHMLNDELLKPYVEKIAEKSVEENKAKEKYTSNLKAVYTNLDSSNDFTFVGDELWCGKINHTTGATEIRRYVIEEGNLVYKSSISNDFGHLNVMDYDPVNDCLIFGNGANDTETQGNYFAIVPHPLNLGDTATLADNAIIYNVDIGYKVQAVWGDGNCGKHNIAILFANDSRNIVKVLLKKTDGEFDGTFVTLETKTLEDVIGVQGADFYGDTLYIGNDTYGVARMSMTDYSVQPVTKHFYMDDGTEFAGAMQGFYIDNNYEWWFFNVTNSDTVTKILLQYYR